MAACFMKGSTRCLITDPSAKATALEHSITCRFLHDRSASLIAGSDSRTSLCPGSADDEGAVFAGAAASEAQPAEDN
jgi:hypothetical protein